MMEECHSGWRFEGKAASMIKAPRSSGTIASGPGKDAGWLNLIFLCPVESHRAALYPAARLINRDVCDFKLQVNYPSYSYRSENES